MSYVLSLWLPILVSAVFVFIVSSIIHMALGYHRNDFGQVPDEGKVMEALRNFKIPVGDFFMPYAPDQKAMNEPDYKEKLEKGPRVVMTVMPAGNPGMGKALATWFLYSLIVSFFAAYITSVALEPGAHYLTVFRFIGTTAFMGYGLAHMQASIWYGRKWSTTFKNLVDALIYALVTAGTFGWLWPGM